LLHHLRHEYSRHIDERLLVFDADLADRVAGDIRAPSIIFWVSAYLGYTFGAQMERQGYRVLADLAKLGIPYQGLGVMARRSLVDRSPDLAEKALRSMIESIAYINNPANKASVMRTLARDLRLAKVEDAESGYEQMRSLYDKKIYPNIDGLRNVVRLLAGSSEQLRKLKVGSIVDDRVVRKLEKEGAF
jgi:hypothetical protein